MKILVAQIIGYGSYAKGLMLEKLQNTINEYPSSEIYYLTCSNSFKRCYFNPYAKPELCYLCKEGKKNSLDLIEGAYTHLKIKDILKEEDTVEAEKFLNGSPSVTMDLMYEEFRLGESTLSTYISKTRDRDLEDVDSSFTREMMINGIEFFIALKRYLKENNFDLVYNFNGRHIYNRAVMDIALALQIELYNVETPRVGRVIEHFKGELPHNIKSKQHLIDKAWKNSKLSESERESVASQYFKKRKSGIKINARNFTEDQLKNSLPKEVDYTKNTVVLYTSSDDEFAAVGDEFSNPYFKDQNEGIYYTAKLFNEKFPHQNLIIRIHPNFAGVEFDYAKKLNALKGKYDNVFIVEPESKVDSYALLDIADKVLTFGSSITTEATFWGKPVIMLGKSFFSGMNISYEPIKIEELSCLLNDNLVAKPKLGALKFGYYLIKGGTTANYYNRDNNNKTYFKGRQIFFFSLKQKVISKITKYSNQFLGIRIFVK